MARIRVFFDGDCGLCHRFVLFVLYRMKGDAFLFSPQGGKIFSGLGLKSDGASIVVYHEKEERAYYRGEAVRLICSQLIWPWRLISWLLKIVPRSVLNRLYDIVARMRYKFFKKPEGVCPIVTDHWTRHFED